MATIHQQSHYQWIGNRTLPNLPNHHPLMYQQLTGIVLHSLRPHHNDIWQRWYVVVNI